MSNINIGNINYSFNKNNFYEIMSRSTFAFLPYYYIITGLLLVYLYTIKFKKYYFANRNESLRKEGEWELFFKSLTFNSPFNILSLDEQKNNNSNIFVGFSKNSYIYIIVSYLITYFIIIDGLLKNFIYSIYANIVQANPNNNPYNNTNCITKISDNPSFSVASNYSKLAILGVVFLIPFSIPYLMKFLNLDAYDVKKNIWLGYVIFGLVFSPLLITIIMRASFSKKIDIFPDLQKYIENKDYTFIEYIKSQFNFSYFVVFTFIFIILFYCIYNLMYIDFKTSVKEKILLYGIFIFLMFIIIPLFIIFVAISVIFSNNYKQNINNDNIIDDVKNGGISSIYELLVKYNYPCFEK
jgi:hypothetical protein